MNACMNEPGRSRFENTTKLRLAFGTVLLGGLLGCQPAVLPSPHETDRNALQGAGIDALKRMPELQSGEKEEVGGLLELHSLLRGLELSTQTTLGADLGSRDARDAHAATLREWIDQRNWSSRNDTVVRLGRCLGQIIEGLHSGDLMLVRRYSHSAQRLIEQRIGYVLGVEHID